MERPTFSESWSRVSRLTPVLRPQVQVRRRTFRGHPWYILHDPIGQTFFRLNPIAYHFVGLLDGKRMVDDAWRLLLERFGDDAPTQPEIVGLLGQLNQASLLRVDLPPDAAPLLRRRTSQRTRRWAGQAMSVLFLQLPLFDPDPLLRKIAPLLRPLLSIPGLVLWALWLIFCAAMFLPHLGTFLRDSTSLLDSANWGWMMLAFILIKLWHELGHALVCQRLGGSVHEAGVMLLVLIPSPYVDTTSAWDMNNRFQRVLVGAAGMMFELTIAGAAALVWLHADPGTLPHHLAHNIVMLASVATILFNANPLMRFDGYFILSDLLEVPNLYDRSANHLKYVLQRYVLKLKNAQPVATDPGEQRILLIYGILAAIYRVVVMVGISLYISTRFFTLGLILALWTLGAWLCFPTAKYLHWLCSSPQLHRHRTRAMVVSGALLLAGVIGLGIVPAPVHERTMGVIEAGERAQITTPTDGIIAQTFVEPGDDVAAGQLLLVLRNPALTARHHELRAQLEGLRVTEVYQTNDPGALAVAQARTTQCLSELAKIEQDLAGLEIRSPRAGRLVGPSLAPMIGMTIRTNQILAEVLDMNSLRVTAMMDQTQNSMTFLRHVRAIELQPTGVIGQPVTSHTWRLRLAGTSQLVHPALAATMGGPVVTDPQDKEQRTTLRPQFVIHIDLPKESASPPIAFYPGQRIHIRYTLEESQPLLGQWLHRFRQVFRGVWEL